MQVHATQAAARHCVTTSATITGVALMPINDIRTWTDDAVESVEYLSAD